MTPATLFVYGTLKRGFKNEFRMRNSRFVANARTRPLYRLLHLGDHPGMVSAPEGGYAIEGELWQVPPETLAALDKFEGTPDIFARMAVELEGAVTSAEAYFYRQARGDERDCGPVWDDTAKR